MRSRKNRLRSFGWIGWCLLPLLAAGPIRGQDSPPVEVVDVDLRTSESAATIVLRTQEPAQWTAEAGGRKLVVFLPRTVPGPSALDRSSRAGLVSLVEVGFAVPGGVPTTRITVHSRKPFEHEIEGAPTGLTIRLAAAGAGNPEPVQTPPNESGAPAVEAPAQDDLEEALQENELLRRRMAELHADRLELRNSLEEARRQAAGASDEASKARVDELELENARLLGEIERRDEELLTSRQTIERLAADAGDTSSNELEARLADSLQREEALAEQLSRSRSDSANLRAWLARAPEILQATRFSVGPGESCLPLRPEPAGTSAVLECLPVGAPLEALSFRPDWLRVRTAEGKEGWVLAARATPARPEVEDLERTVAALRRELEAQQDAAPVADATEVAELEQRASREASARASAEAALASARDRIEQLEQDLSRLGQDETGQESAVAALEADLASARRQSEADQRRLRALLGEIDRQQLSVSQDADPCLTVRAGPGTNQGRLDCVEPGVVLSVEDATDGWLSVRTPSGVSGWVSARFVAANASEESAGRIARLERELGAAREQAEGLAARVVDLGTELEANAIAAQEAAEAGDAERARLAADLEQANRRTRETLDLLEQARAERTQAEEALTALSERQQLERAEALGALKIAKAVVREDVDPCLSFREAPEVGSRAVDCLAPGTEVQTVALAGGWFRVRLEDGREGWSSGEFLESSEQRELRELRNRLADRDASLADLESRLAGAQQGSSELEQLGSDLEASRQEVTRVTEELAESERLRTQGEQQLADLRQEVDRLGALAGRAGEVPLLESALEQARGALEASEAKVRALEQERQEASAEEPPSREMEDELARLRSELGAAKQSLEASQAETAELRGELTQRVEELSRLETVENQSLASKQRIDSLQTQLAASKEALAESESRVLALQEKAAELEARESVRQAAEVLEPLPPTAEETEVAMLSDDSSSATPPAPPPAEPLPSMEPVSAPEPGPEVLSADLEAFARAWAEAWSEQRVEDYLSFYGEAFVPPSEASREAWASLRRERLTRPEFIEVEISNVRTEILSPDRATVTFDQSYRSNTFQDRVVKTLELAREDDLWKIVVEEAR